MSSSNETTETTETGSTAKAAKAPKAPKAAASKTAKAPTAETVTPAPKAPKAPKAPAKTSKAVAGAATDAVATAAKAPKAQAAGAAAAPAAKAAKPAKAAKAAAGAAPEAAAAPACPCGTGQSLAECCGPILAGKSQAPTAEALMRSRYAAYATGDIAYLRRSLDTRWQKDFDEQATLEWSKNATWQGLSIVDTKAGGPADDEGIVEFIAAFNMDGQDQKIRERAQFKKQDGVWFYVDGKVKSTQETVVSGPKVGRNDPCPCGSGKKFKKCCA